MSSNDDYSFITATLVIAVILCFVGAGFGIHACVIADQATLGKAEQKVQTDNFRQSEAYREGLQRDFDELLLSYSRAKSRDERATIFSVMRHRAEGCPPEFVPQDVKDLLAKGVTDPAL